MADDTMAVPALPEAVRAFMDRSRNRFLSTLTSVREAVEAMIAGSHDLDCVYKVYTRGHLQGGEELKSARKVRLKFDEFNLAKGITEASLLDVPDIVGMTIVVPYPSDISTVAAGIDALVDAGTFVSALPPEPSDGVIRSRHGRAIQSGGYFACHYNVRVPGVSRQPICEVQIKTLLHDAWGAKTHDLTYKPTGRIGAELLTSFELLGANLANLDQQSDALRSSIVRTSAVRERKRRVVQVAVLREASAARIAHIGEADLRSRLEALQARVVALDPGSAIRDVDAVLVDLMRIFDEERSATARVLCHLAATVQRARCAEQAQEAIKVLEDEAADDIGRLRVRSMAALTAFSIGETGEAIDVAESALREADPISKSGLNPDARRAFDAVSNALCSSLAYYHADVTGSHDGEKRRSVEKAAEYLRESMALYPSVGIPAAGLFAPNEEIVRTITAPSVDNRAFFALDNEAFVMIQTAVTVDDVLRAKSRMELIHDNAPAALASLSPLVRDYHDYCSRMRLAELETS